MVKKVNIGSAELYQGRMEEILPGLIADGLRAAVVCSDPPYLLTSGRQTPGGMHERIGGAGYNNGGHLVACDIDWLDFMPLFYQALDDGHGNGHAYVMANSKNLRAMLNAAVIAGFDFHNMLVWDKVGGPANRWYMKNCEFTGFFYKGEGRQIADCGSKSCVRYAHTDVTKHPTEKPVALMEMYIRNSSMPGQLILDPFMGSGSTGVAAVKSGRRFVGIELEDEWFDAACMRIQEAAETAQEGLF